MQNELKNNSNYSSNKNQLTSFYILSLLFIIIIFLYIYIRIIRPFSKLENFALDVSKGNFDSPLYVERQNLFGDFTWAFDMMRCEIKKARSCEKEAIENNKTVIATISHDIKTPIASIRAYTEALKLNMDSTPERKNRYLSVIIKKCDEVSKLTNDLFLHSLSDLEKLEITCSLHKSDIVIPEILESIVSNQIEVNIANEIPKCNISVDIKRLEQVFENIISNSIKYSYGEKIDIDFKTDNSYLICSLNDYGKGISDEDMPFIFEKFYRGKDTGTKPGAGLGLFIVKYIMGQMNGDVSVTNRNDGLTVTLKIKIS